MRCIFDHCLARLHLGSPHFIVAELSGTFVLQLISPRSIQTASVYIVGTCCVAEPPTSGLSVVVLGWLWLVAMSQSGPNPCKELLFSPCRVGCHPALRFRLLLLLSGVGQFFQSILDILRTQWTAAQMIVNVGNLGRQRSTPCGEDSGESQSPGLATVATTKAWQSNPETLAIANSFRSRQTHSLYLFHQDIPVLVVE